MDLLKEAQVRSLTLSADILNSQVIAVILSETAMQAGAGGHKHMWIPCEVIPICQASHTHWCHRGNTIPWVPEAILVQYEASSTEGNTWMVQGTCTRGKGKSQALDSKSVLITAIHTNTQSAFKWLSSHP